MSFFLHKLKSLADEKFGHSPHKSPDQWLNYWSTTIKRNELIFHFFQSKLNLDLEGKSVFDVGCGTAGLSSLVAGVGGVYFGSDYFQKTVELADAFIRDLPDHEQTHLIRASGHQLPFRSETFDYVIAFDIIEHLVGGISWQYQFLKEVARVLKPEGVLLLTTPNWLCPFEATRSSLALNSCLHHGPIVIFVGFARFFFMITGPTARCTCFRHGK
jgi:SAM-dependent methyltransferase